MNVCDNHENFPLNKNYYSKEKESKERWLTTCILKFAFKTNDKDKKGKK